MKYLPYLAVLFAVGVIAYAFLAVRTGGVGAPGSTHVHADFKLYVNGGAVDFSQSKYQLKSNYVHFEGGDGDVVHVHATGITLGFTLKTLGVQLSKDCIILDGTSYCNNAGSTLKLLVNGVPSTAFENHEIKNQDRLLLSYGSETGSALQAQAESVTSLANRM